MNRIGVTGANGNLGSELVRIGCVSLECDITDLHQIQDALEEVEPDVIINTAAKTNVDECETKEGEKEAIAVNTRGIANLREIYDGQIIHISTSYVFNGKRGPYRENTKFDPLQGYGFSKLGGEIIFQSYDYPTDVIVRTVGLYGGKRDDFTDMVIRELSSGREIKIFKDLRFNPTYVPHLAIALMKLADIPYPPKILNIASGKSISRYKFSQMIADEFDFDKKLLIPTSEINEWVIDGAERPRKAGLRTNKAKKLGLPIYSIQDGLKELKYQWDSKQA